MAELQSVPHHRSVRVAGAGAFVPSLVVDNHRLAEAIPGWSAERIEEKTSIVVGVNEFAEDDKLTLPIMTIDESVERDQVARLVAFRQRRHGKVDEALAALHAAAAGSKNVMPHIVDAVRNDCTVGEIVATLKRTLGEHTEQNF